jgi:hypothetical protein
LGEEKQAAKIQKEAYKVLTQIANMPPGTPPQQQLQAMIDLLMFIKTQSQKPRTGTFKRELLVRDWDREEIKDETGNVVETKKEEFVPELDIKVRVMDERPTDRNYWSKIVMEAMGMGLIGPKAFWQTIIDGKIPNLDDITEELDQLQQAKAEAAQAQMEAEQQQEAAKIQSGMAKQKLQNQSVEKQVALKAMMGMRKENNNAKNSGARK